MPLFNSAEFNDEAYFQETIFNDTANFSLAKFKEHSFFLNASFKNVDFTGTYILLMNIEWKQLEGKLVYDKYFYQSLISNFGKLGLVEDANDAYYAYHVEKRKRIDIKSPKGFLRISLERVFLDLSCWYGVRPLRLIGWVGLFIGLFAVLYWWIEDKGKKKSEDWWERFLDFVFLSVSIFTMRGKWNDWKTSEKYIRCFRIATVVEGSLGWILMTLFVISLTMTWIKF
jgi:hypothetical protein